MDNLTIYQLNKLNSLFYEQVGEEFSQSRQQPWEGWEKLVPFLETLSQDSNLKVLDLGCGNGRFAQFLSKTLTRDRFEYQGLDNSSKLLGIAQEALPNFTFKEFDLIEDLLKKNNHLGFYKEYNPTLITLFGVLHHIPSFTLRHQFFLELSSLLNLGSYMVVSLWQFMSVHKLKNKVVQPSLAGLTNSNLEENDYILNWLRGKTAYRYCHFTTAEEMKRLLEATKFEVQETFLADGQGHTSNLYYILKKI